MNVSFNLRGYKEMIQGWITEKMKRETEFAFPLDWLPDTGLIVTGGEGKKMLAAVAVYFERTSPVAYIGWIAANPENTLEESANAIAFGIQSVPDYARSMGAKHLLTTTGNTRINRIFDRQGFVGGSDKVQHKYLYLGD